jgi:hypothetical protein
MEEAVQCSSDSSKTVRPTTSASGYDLTSSLDALSRLGVPLPSYSHNPQVLYPVTSGLKPILFTGCVERSRRFCLASCLRGPNRACQYCNCATSWQVDGYMRVRVLVCSMASYSLLIIIRGKSFCEPDEARHRKLRSSPNKHCREIQGYLASQCEF